MLRSVSGRFPQSSMNSLIDYIWATVPASFNGDWSRTRRSFHGSTEPCPLRPHCSASSPTQVSVPASERICNHGRPKSVRVVRVLVLDSARTAQREAYLLIVLIDHPAVYTASVSRTGDSARPSSKQELVTGVDDKDDHAAIRTRSARISRQVSEHPNKVLPLGWTRTAHTQLPLRPAYRPVSACSSFGCQRASGRQNTVRQRTDDHGAA